VRAYLTTKFDVGERTGNKADPEQVAIDMRNARDESNVRLFERECWLTKTQIQGFFSRLAATRRRHQFSSAQSNVSEDNDEIIDCLVEEARHTDLMKEIDNSLNLKHPVIYDVYDLFTFTKINYNLSMFQCLRRCVRTSRSHFAPRTKKQIF
jgi:hypothetical protein